LRAFLRYADSDASFREYSADGRQESDPLLPFASDR
jgi:hypothetical protein